MRPKDCVARSAATSSGSSCATSPTRPRSCGACGPSSSSRSASAACPSRSTRASAIVVAPADGTDVDELLQRADVAMYVAKEQHSGVVRYRPDQNHYDAANLALIGELRQAIEIDQLVLHYQPKATLATGGSRPSRRWSAGAIPTLGLLYPDRFVPLVEQTDLIDKLTEWVVHQALRDLGALGPGRPTTSPWRSTSRPATSGRPGFADLVDAGAGRASGIGADRLVIEITETALLTDPEGAARRPGQLDALGVEGQHRRLRQRPDLARLPVRAAGPRAEDRSQLHLRHARQPGPCGHRPLHRRPRPQPPPPGGRGRGGDRTEIWDILRARAATPPRATCWPGRCRWSSSAGWLATHRRARRG